MLQIRNGVFETNSSSTHSICIGRRNIDWKNSLPKELIFKHEEYGWEEKIYYDTQNKANYLYQAICDIFSKPERNKLTDHIAKVLLKYDVFAEFEADRSNEFGLKYGDIDHPYDLIEFIQSVCKSEKKLLRYLFSDESFVMTGNDNTDTSVDFHVDYKHDEYYKGN